MKAAILIESKQPLAITDIGLPDHLDVGQVLVKLEYTFLQNVSNIYENM